MLYKARALQLLLGALLFVVLSACNGGPPEYTITFDTMTEATIDPITAPAGEAIYKPDDPVREGYRFNGWQRDEDMFLFSVMPDEDIVLTADWSKYYTIFFDSDGGSMIDPIIIAEGDPIALDTEPTKDHFKFTGWNYNGNPFDLETMPSGDMMLTATWTPASTITFDAMVFDRYLGEYVEVDVPPIVEVAGEPISAPEIPEYLEYKFLSWQRNGIDYEFTTMPDNDITLTANWLQLSNLPALFIDLYEEDNTVVPLSTVTREIYETSTISLENTDEEFQIHNASALFKGRGEGSWWDSGDKRGYRLKFDEEQSILGSVPNRHWVLLAGANFDDVTMFRNKLAFNMTNEIFSNIDYATYNQWVDVYINGEYRGVYLLTEHVRVDEGRIDIESEYGELDTGYLIEYDAYAEGVPGIDFFRVDGVRYPFSMHYPEPDEFVENGFTSEQYRAQVTYIQGLVQNMVTAVMDKDFEAFGEYADIDSFIDMYILHEFFKNIDTGYSSFFIYREPGGKLTAGPPWDFDATLGSSPTRGNGSPLGIYVGLSVQAFSSRTASELLITLYDTPEFKTAVVARWTTLSPIIQAYIDDTLTEEMMETYRFAMGRNYVKWPSPQGYGPPTTQTEAEADWIMHIGRLRDWMTDRREWLDEEWAME